MTNKSYTYLQVFLLFVAILFCWGIVAPMVNTHKDVGAWPLVFYINLVSLPGLIALITGQHFRGQKTQTTKKDDQQIGLRRSSWGQFRLSKTSLKTYAEMVVIGAIWPCAYSYCFFRAIIIGGEDSAATAVTVNYTWPAFALFFAVLFNKRLGNKTTITKTSIAATLGALLAIGYVFYLEKDNAANLKFFMPLAILAATTQGFFNYYTSVRKTIDPWVLTLTVEVATVIISGAAMLAIGGFRIPVWQENKVAILALGIFANSVGFFVFVAGAQISSQFVKQFGGSLNYIWNVGNCLILPAALALIPVFGGNHVPLHRWLVAIFVSVCLALQLGGEWITQKIKVPRKHKLLTPQPTPDNLH